MNPRIRITIFEEQRGEADVRTGVDNQGLLDRRFEIINTVDEHLAIETGQQTGIAVMDGESGQTYGSWPAASPQAGPCGAHPQARIPPKNRPSSLDVTIADEPRNGTKRRHDQLRH